MANIQTQRVLEKLDEHLGRNDYASAEKHLLYWLGEARAVGDNRCQLLLLNELAGLYRKLTRQEDAIRTVGELLRLISLMGIENNIGAGTTYINCATVYKAFGRAGEALPLFEKAKNVIAELNANGQLPVGETTVYIRGGDYRLTDTIRFTLKDSGKNGAKIVYKAQK